MRLWERVILPLMLIMDFLSDRLAERERDIRTQHTSGKRARKGERAEEKSGRGKGERRGEETKQTYSQTQQSSSL